MSHMPINPLCVHPVFAPIIAEVRSGALGQPLAVYASARSKAGATDSLLDLGVPVIDFLLELFGGEIRSVMATNERVRSEEFDAWFLSLAFADGLIATVDVGNFLPAAYPDDLELRLEVSGTDAVIIAEPEKVGVTVFGLDGLSREGSYSQSYHDDLRRFATAISEDEQRPVIKLIAAARQSAATDQLVSI